MYRRKEKCYRNRCQCCTPGGTHDLIFVKFRVATEIYEVLKTTFGGEVHSHSNIFEQSSWFKDG